MVDKDKKDVTGKKARKVQRKKKISEVLEFSHERAYEQWCREEKPLYEKREQECRDHYYDSFFYKFVALEKEKFHDGNDWRMGNDERYYLFNEIHEMGLPIKEVLAEDPSLEERSLLYYYIYKNTIVVTYGFFDVQLIPSTKEHHVAIRDYDRRPDMYGDDEMAGINTHPYISEFRETYWERHIRPEHRHLPLKILYTRKKGQATDHLTVGFDSYSDAIFYKELKDIEQIFVM